MAGTTCTHGLTYDNGKPLPAADCCDCTPISQPLQQPAPQQPQQGGEERQ